MGELCEDCCDHSRMGEVNKRAREKYDYCAVYFAGGYGGGGAACSYWCELPVGHEGYHEAGGALEDTEHAVKERVEEEPNPVEKPKVEKKKYLTVGSLWRRDSDPKYDTTEIFYVEQINEDGSVKGIAFQVGPKGEKLRARRKVTYWADETEKGWQFASFERLTGFTTEGDTEGSREG